MKRLLRGLSAVVALGTLTTFASLSVGATTIYPSWENDSNSSAIRAALVGYCESMLNANASKELGNLRSNYTHTTAGSETAALQVENSFNLSGEYRFMGNSLYACTYYSDSPISSTYKGTSTNKAPDTLPLLTTNAVYTNTLASGIYYLTYGSYIAAGSSTYTPIEYELT